MSEKVQKISNNDEELKEQKTQIELLNNFMNKTIQDMTNLQQQMVEKSGTIQQLEADLKRQSEESTKNLITIASLKNFSDELFQRLDAQKNETFAAIIRGKEEKIKTLEETIKKLQNNLNNEIWIKPVEANKLLWIDTTIGFVFISNLETLLIRSQLNLAPQERNWNVLPSTCKSRNQSRKLNLI